VAVPLLVVTSIASAIAGALHDALPAGGQVLAALQRLGAVFLQETAVVGTELGAGYRDRPAALTTVKQGGAGDCSDATELLLTVAGGASRPRVRACA
jgi:hypothetical protein